MKFFIIVLLLISTSAIAQVSPAFRSNKFNPSFGINTTMLAKDSTVETSQDGFSLQGVELQFNSDVDTYLRAQVVIGIHPIDEEEEEGEEGHGTEYEIHPEEAFVETISIEGISFKFGQFYSQFGKYNGIHLHAQPFVYRGIVQTEMFGSEGLTSPGISTSFLAPLNWFSEFTLEAFQADNENLYESTNHATAYVAKWKNLWDLSDELTMELGLSALDFKNKDPELSDETSVTGSDITFKWRPNASRNNQSFMWSTEYIRKKRKGELKQTIGGITSFFRYQIKQRWFLQVQYEYLGLDKSRGLDSAQAYTALLGFIPSEFSAFRLQYDKIEDSGRSKQENRISLQINISIGAHPAHMY